MEVMKEKETAGTNLKWDRKPPVIKAESPKGLMTEIIDLERLFSELGFKTHRKKWGVFRNALQGKGKEKLEYELERVGMTPERIAKLSEEETKKLYDWAMGILEKLLHLDPEKKCEIANDAMKRVWMPPNSGPGGAERFIRDYE